MRIIRNLYFWLVLGTVVFVGFMDWSSSVRISRRDREDIQAERELEGEDSTEPLSGFGAGFVTACIVGGFWFGVYHETHPPERKRELRNEEDID
jgi:hypothetical protein